MISPWSLQALVDISRHHALGPRITHLVIGLDNLSVLIAAHPFLFPALDLDQHTEHLQPADSQQYFLETGGAVELLTQALVNLPNLQTVDLRTFNSRTRYRDNGRWASYGHSESPHWTRYIDNGAVLTGDADFSAGFVRQIFRSVLIALGRSNSSIHGLEVLSKNATCLTDKAFTLFPELDCVPHQLPGVLSRLTKLHLDVDLARGLSKPLDLSQRPQASTSTPKTAAEAFDPASSNLRRFLNLTPNLTWLRLNFSHSGGYATGARLLTWLSLSPEEIAGWSEANPKPIAPPLRRLDLGNSSFAPETVTRIFQKFNNLASCSFRNLILQRSSAPEGSDDGEDDDGDINGGDRGGWARAIRNMVTDAPNLRYLQLHFLREERGHARDQVIFVEPDEASHEHSIEISAVTRPSLEALAKRTWPHKEFYKLLASRQIMNGDDDSAGSEDSADSDQNSVDDTELLQQLMDEEDELDGGDGDVEVDVDDMYDANMDF